MNLARSESQKTPAPVRVGDYVEVPIMMAELRRRAHGHGRKRVERMRGRVIWTGPRFATVRLDVGYAESFWYEQLTVLRSEAS